MRRDLHRIGCRADNSRYPCCWFCCLFLLRWRCPVAGFVVFMVQTGFLELMELCKMFNVPKDKQNIMYNITMILFVAGLIKYCRRSDDQDNPRHHHSIRSVLAVMDFDVVSREVVLLQYCAWFRIHKIVTTHVFHRLTSEIWGSALFCLVRTTSSVRRPTTPLYKYHTSTTVSSI